MEISRSIAFGFLVIDWFSVTDLSPFSKAMFIAFQRRSLAVPTRRNSEKRWVAELAEREDWSLTIGLLTIGHRRFWTTCWTCWVWLPVFTCWENYLHENLSVSLRGCLSNKGMLKSHAGGRLLRDLLLNVGPKIDDCPIFTYFQHWRLAGLLCWGISLWFFSGSLVISMLAT